MIIIHQTCKTWSEVGPEQEGRLTSATNTKTGETALAMYRNVRYKPLGRRYNATVGREIMQYECEYDLQIADQNEYTKDA